MLELIVVVGILIMATALSLPFFSSFQVDNTVRTNSDFLAQSLRLAQIRAMAGYQGLDWGVYFDNTAKKFIVYAGSDYANRTTDLDLETSFDAVFNLSTDFGNEINFAIYSGLPSVNGTTTFSGSTEVTRYNTINSLGLISAK